MDRLPAVSVTPWSSSQKRCYRVSATLENESTPTSEERTRIDTPISMLVVGVPKEIYEDEKRVAITPKNVEQLKKAGFTVVVEKGAGVGAKISDQEYGAAGAAIVDTAAALSADIVLKVHRKIIQIT